MPNSLNKKKYNAEYAKKYLKRIPLDMQLSKYEQVKAAALAAGETVNGYIKKAVDMRLSSGTAPDPVGDQSPAEEPIEKPLAGEKVK